MIINQSSKTIKALFVMLGPFGVLTLCTGCREGIVTWLSAPANHNGALI